MRQKLDRTNLIALAGIVIAVVVPLVLASCATTPWYKDYDIDSRETLISVASVPMLIRALEDEKPLVRLEAVRALAEIGPDAKDAVPALMDAANDDEYVVRQAVADTLEVIELGPDRKEDEEVGEVDLLVQTVRLGSKDWLIQREAVNKLVDMGQGAADALPALILVIEDRSYWHQHYNEILKGAAIALGNIGPEARTANPALIQLMENKDYDVRREVVKAMGKIGPKSDTAVIEVLTSAVHGDPELIEIRHLLARLLPSKYEYLAYKGILHGDADFNVRREAAASLGNFGSDAVSAVPTLRDASLTDIDYNVRRQATFSLCRIHPGGESAMLALDWAIDDKDKKKGPSTRAAAVLELRNARPEDRERWLPRIINCLDDVEEGVRFNAVKTLAEYKVGGDMVYNALNRVALEDKSLKVKKEALETLRYFKKDEPAE